MAPQIFFQGLLSANWAESMRRMKWGVCLHMLSKKSFIGKVLMAAFVLAMIPEVVSIIVMTVKMLIAAFVLAIFGVYSALHVVNFKLMSMEATTLSIIPRAALEIAMIMNAIGESMLVLSMVKKVVVGFVRWIRLRPCRCS